MVNVVLCAIAAAMPLFSANAVDTVAKVFEQLMGPSHGTPIVLRATAMTTTAAADATAREAADRRQRRRLRLLSLKGRHRMNTVAAAPTRASMPCQSINLSCTEAII